MLSPPAARKSCMLKCFLSPQKPKWSFGSATRLIRKPVAHASGPIMAFQGLPKCVARYDLTISQARGHQHAVESATAGVCATTAKRLRQHSSEKATLRHL